MKIKDKTVIITGAANGIGAEMSRRFALEGAKALVLCDLDAAGAAAVARSIDMPENRLSSLGCDVAKREDIDRVVDHALQRHGGIDVFCSNAGIMMPGNESTPPGDWQRSWEVNVMSHVHAADAVLPTMIARGEGYLLNTVSAAGLLTSPGAAPYAVTKHAALAFAEWLAITYGASGIRVSAICPQAIRTKMIEDAIASGGGAAVSSGGELLEASHVVDQVIEALDREKFLVLSHPETQKYVEAKVSDIDRWIAGMRKFASASN